MCNRVGVLEPVVGSPSVRSMRMEAEPCLGCAFNISAPFRTAALMSVAGMSKGRERWGGEATVDVLQLFKHS